MDVFEYVLWFVVSVEMAEMISLISARISAFFFAVSEETVASFEVLEFLLVAVPVLEGGICRRGYRDCVCRNRYAGLHQTCHLGNIILRLGKWWYAAIFFTLPHPAL